MGGLKRTRDGEFQPTGPNRSDRDGQARNYPIQPGLSRAVRVQALAPFPANQLDRTDRLTIVRSRPRLLARRQRPQDGRFPHRAGSLPGPIPGLSEA